MFELTMPCWHFDEFEAVELTWGQGLKDRMEQSRLFMKPLDNLCIQMTHAGKKPDRQRQRISPKAGTDELKVIKATGRSRTWSARTGKLVPR